MIFSFFVVYCFVSFLLQGDSVPGHETVGGTNCSTEDCYGSLEEVKTFALLVD
jgi:hypothetical protein